LLTILLRTTAAIVIARPAAENIKVLLALSRFWGLPELVMYLKPPATKKPVATKPARPAIAVMTLWIKDWTWLTPAVSAEAELIKISGRLSIKTTSFWLVCFIGLGSLSVNFFFRFIRPVFMKSKVYSDKSWVIFEVREPKNSTFSLLCDWFLDYIVS
jgi:hypothetical protein